MSTTLTFDFARLWRSHPRETAGLGMLGLAAAIALGGAASSTSLVPGREADARTAAMAAALPALPDVNAVRPVAPEDALAINNQIPFATGPNPAARPFNYAAGSTETRERALECLTSAIYYEAGQESLEGQQGVAQVVLNRVRHPAFPASVCGVVYQGSTRSTGCQFTFTCDGSLARAPEPSAWNRARAVAKAALAGFVQPAVGNATHYHASYVAPYWAPTLAKTAVIGAHIFYRWGGGWGTPGAFAQRWSAREADPKALRYAAMSVPHQVIAPTVLAPAMTKLAGVQVMENNGKRVRVLFTPEARKAADEAKHVDYVERVAASDNLRWTLDAGAPQGADQAPLGKPAAPAPAAAPSGAQ
jgi:spore germination cell wall hydrolase CwlJ-like protein